MLNVTRSIWSKNHVTYENIEQPLFFSTCLYISERHYKCDLNISHSIQVQSYVNVYAYVSRTLQRICDIRR